MKNRKQMRVLAKSVMAFFGLAGGTMFASRAQASLVINLMFPDGTNTMSVTPDEVGQDFPVLVYGTVTGLNPVTTTPGATTGNFDGIQYTYYDVVSSTGPGGALPGGIDNGSVDPAYAPTLNPTFAAFGSQAGTVQDLNGDGIADLGATSSQMTDISKPRAAEAIWDNSYLAGYNPTGTPGIIVGGANNNSVSFLLETIYFQTGSALSPGESTALDPSAVQLQPFYAPSNYFEDDPTLPSPNNGVGAQYTYTTVSAGSLVQFNVVAVPEPTTSAISCLLGVGLLSRRRRRNPKKLFANAP